MSHRFFLLLLLSALAGSGPAALAQQGGVQRVPVTVATVDQLPQPGEPSLILRSPRPGEGDVILLAPTASTADLSQAVRALMLARGRDGDRAPQAASMRVRRATTSPPRDLPWAGRVLEALRRAAPRAVPNVGTVPAVVIWLPRQQRPTPADATQ